MDKLTQELGEALDTLQDVLRHPRMYNTGQADNALYRADKVLRKYHDALAREREARPQDDCGIGRYLSEAE